MRAFLPVTWIGLMLLSAASWAADFQPGQYDEFIQKELRRIMQAAPLHTTTVRDVAPEFVVEKVEGLSWEQALAEAERRFGEHQPERALFLRKYLAKGAPESQLEELHWPDRGLGFQSGPNLFVSLDWHGPEKAKAPAAGTDRQPKDAVASAPPARDIRFARIMEPVLARIDTSVVSQKLSAEASLAFPDRQFKGITFKILSFDEEDRLVWTLAEVSAGPGGPTIQLTCSANSKFGEPGVHFYQASLSDPSGNHETLEYNADLELQMRWVQKQPWKMSYHETYEHGRLRQRQHEDWHKNPDGSNTRTVEQFP
jgi:hypothetical protein